MLGVDITYHLSPSPSPFIPQTYIKKTRVSNKSNKKLRFLLS